MLAPEPAADAQSRIRGENLRIALQAVFDAPGEQSRAGIARRLGVTSATASSLVADLIQRRYVVNGAAARSTGGKPATTLRVDADYHRVLVVRVDVEHVTLVSRRLDATLDAEWSFAAAPGEHSRAIATAVAEFAQRHPGQTLAAAVEVPGTTDGAVVFDSVQLGWNNESLAASLEAELHAPVLVVNDVDAEAVTDLSADPEPRGLRLYVHVGAGVGAALTLDGALLPGSRGRIGEIGHVEVDASPTAPMCGCGRRGCLEAMAVDPTHSVAERAEALGGVIRTLAAMLDPVEVVVGGSPAARDDDYVAALRRAVTDSTRGGVEMPVRAERADIAAHIGGAQLALAHALGVRWSPAQLAAITAPIG